MNFVEIPNLPKNEACVCIAGKQAKPYEKELSKYGVKLLYINDNSSILPNISSHSDLAVNHSGSNNIFIDKAQIKLKRELLKYGFNVIEISENVLGKYPNDCLLNCVFTDSLFICNLSAVSKELLNYAKNKGYKIINVKQGYTKCSICVVSDNAFITDDEGIYNSLKSENVDVLLVKKGSVALDGFDYGFIGGCCGKISKNKLVFFGDISKHSDYNRIKSFCEFYNVEIISLNNSKLKDIGSLIPILEKE